MSFQPFSGSVLRMTPRIERDVTVSWRHQVLFTQNIFDAENAVLRDTLADDPF